MEENYHNDAGNIKDDSSYQYQVGGSLPIGAPTYVKRQTNDDLYVKY